MDNYKIKVKDEQNFKEVVSLINTLGYGINFSYSNASGEVVKGLFLKRNGLVEWTHRDTYFDFNDSKELTLPQLRDLVVLKRNDVKDANYKLFISSSQGYLSLYKASDDVFYAYASKSKCWDKSRAVGVNTKDLEPIDIEHASEEKDPALISGADALRALADGKEVEANNSDFGYWIDARNLSVKDFFDDIHIFRLKPQTIKVELEIPAPYKAKIGGRDDTSFVLNVGRHQYLYQNEDDYTKARDALEAVFDSALRGTNS
ncbi:hypothetical protein V8Q03_07105 [Acinetobacter baumannii]